jgi:hypothetical protein
MSIWKHKVPQSEWPSSRKQTTTNAGEDAGKKNPHAVLVGI